MTYRTRVLCPSSRAARATRMIGMTAPTTPTDPRPAPATEPTKPELRVTVAPRPFLLRGPLAVFRRPLRRPRET